MQQSKAPHISEQEAKDRLEQQAGLSFEYAHAQYNKNLKQWSFAVKNKAGAVVFSAVSFKDFAPYRALAQHLNTSFEEVLDRYVFVYGAQHECGQGQDDERYCLIDKGWLKVSGIEEAFIKKFGQYRKDYEMHDELWVLTIDGSECSSATYKKHPKPGWPPRAERAAFALEELESQALQLALTAFLTPAEQPLSTSDKEPSTEPPQTAPHSQKPVQPTEPAVSNTDTGKPKKQNEHKGTAQDESETSEIIFPDEEDIRAAMLEVDKFIEDICASTPKVEIELPEGITVGEQDDADDLYNIAINYQNGLGGLKQDKTTALECYRKAADKGHADAMNMIGRYYGEGWGDLKKDEAAALEWCRKAADAGSVSAMYNIAVYYQNGLGGLKADKATALEWYRKAADKGDADAMYEIGTYYSKGVGGLKKDETTAIEWFRKAAAQGNSAAKNIINQYDNKGRTPLLAIRLQEIREFLEMFDFPRRLGLLALLIYFITLLYPLLIINDTVKAFKYYDKGDKVTALTWFRKAADKGHTAAMNMIGRYYEEGWGGLKQDKAAALEWFRKAADAGNEGSMNEIAEYYEQGKGGLKKDEAAALEWYRKAADVGDADAMVRISKYYVLGLGGLKKDEATALEWFRKSGLGNLNRTDSNSQVMYKIAKYYDAQLWDQATALEWYHKAADAGNATALYNIAVYYAYGFGGLKADKAAAVEWYRKAANAGNLDAMNMMGRYYHEGWGGLKQDKAAALEWFRKAADAGDSAALYNLAGYYEDGSGGLKADKAAALEWYCKAADAGNADAMVRISKYYVLGLGDLKKDDKTALEWFRKSGLGNLNSTDSNSQVMYKIAKYYDAQLWDKATALEWFRKAADAGNADAMYNLAIYYADGSGGLKADQAAAVEWYRKAANAGNAAAMNMMGRYYDEGWGGLKKDEAAALEWYRKAADAGNADALYNLAICYADGSGGLKADKAAALEWYRKAADKGHAAAMYEIGTYYSKGLGGLKKDEVSALEWFRKAADKGNVAAMELIIAYYSKAWERLTKLKQQSGKYDANPDDAAAMNKIAKYYEKGWGGLKQDETAALEWYRKAADIGHTDAMNKIAEYYEQGKGGLKADEAAALEWYHKLADEGYTVAMNKIAEYYRQGRGGLKEDTAAALEWYRKSADEGNAAAAEMVKELETHTATDKSTAIGNRKKASIYFKKIFRFDRYWAISLIIYLVGSVSELIRSFFDSDTAKKRFFILSSVSITAFGLLILYSALTFYAMYI